MIANEVSTEVFMIPEEEGLVPGVAIKVIYCGIIVVRGGLMFMDFVVYPYPRIYVSSNLYFLIIISKHRFSSFKTVFR